jgi:hypothetical protein
MADLLQVKTLVSVTDTQVMTIKAAVGSVGKILWLKVEDNTNTSTYVVDAGTDGRLDTSNAAFEFSTSPWADTAKSAKKEIIIDDTAYVTILAAGTIKVSYALLNCAVPVIA